MGLKKLMLYLDASLVNIPIESFGIRTVTNPHSSWTFVGMFGSDLEFGSPLHKDELYKYFPNSYDDAQFVNSSLANFFYCIIKFHNVLRTNVEYTFDDFKRDYGIIEPDRTLTQGRDFWTVLYLWQTGETDY